MLVQPNSETLERLKDERTVAGKTRGHGINWRQASGEALLIFVGVAVALLGQAWWEHRGERVLVEEHTANLLQELDANAEGLGRIIEWRERRRSQGAELLRMMASPQAPPIRDSIVFLATQLMSYNSFRPATAALESLIGSGNLGLFNDPQVRLGVSEYAQALVRHDEKEAELLGFQWDDWFAFGVEVVALMDAPAVRAGIPESPEGSLYDSDVDVLLSRRFENLLVLHLLSQRDAISRAGQLLARTTELRDHLTPLGPAF